MGRLSKFPTLCFSNSNETPEVHFQPVVRTTSVYWVSSNSQQGCRCECENGTDGIDKMADLLAHEEGKWLVAAISENLVRVAVWCFSVRKCSLLIQLR